MWCRVGQAVRANVMSEYRPMGVQEGAYRAHGVGEVWERMGALGGNRVSSVYSPLGPKGYSHPH